jgi:hypothetical protein
MIEDRLAATLERVAAGGPDEAGAFDRFLRRRSRRSRRLAAGTTALCLAAVAAVAMGLPRLDLGGDTRPRLYVSGVAGPERWRPGPLVAVAPLEGFEVDVPAGWEASPTWKGIELRPVDPELRRRLAGPVQLGTAHLRRFYNPDPNVGKDGTYKQEGFEFEGGFGLPGPATPGPHDRRSRGGFPGDRGWIRFDGQDGSWRSTQWHISWPYRCSPGVTCPSPLALRTLRAAFRVQAGAAAPVDHLAEGLLRSARPITNAVRGQPQAPRPDCVDGRSMVLLRRIATSSPTGRNALVVKFWWLARTTSDLVPCTIRGPFGVELVDRAGRPLEVEGNGLALVPPVDLPESSVGRQPGRMELHLKWINWCEDGPARLRWLGDPGRTVPIDPPNCTDRTTPSRLSVELLLR